MFEIILVDRHRQAQFFVPRLALRFVMATSSPLFCWPSLRSINSYFHCFQRLCSSPSASLIAGLLCAAFIFSACVSRLCVFFCIAMSLAVILLILFSSPFRLCHIFLAAFNNSSLSVSYIMQLRRRLRHMICPQSFYVIWYCRIYCIHCSPT